MLVLASIATLVAALAADSLRAVLNARAMTLDLLNLLIEQPKVTDDLLHVQLVDSQQIILQNLIGALDVLLKSSLTLHRPRERRLVMPFL